MKLERGAALDETDRACLDEFENATQQVDAGVDLVRMEENPRRVKLIVKGVAYRYKYVSSGRRAIVAFMLPGDFCDLHVEILGQMDHSIGTLTPCVVADIDPVVIDEISTRHPRVLRAFWWATLVDEAVLREWIVSIARRPAEIRLAHLFCELHLRLQTVGLADTEQFDCPLTQDVLADSLGLSTVHINRVLQNLRHEGLLHLQGRRALIPDTDRLRDFAGFDPTYLHLGRREESRGAEAQEPGLRPRRL